MASRRDRQRAALGQTLSERSKLARKLYSANTKINKARVELHLLAEGRTQSWIKPEFRIPRHDGLTPAEAERLSQLNQTLELVMREISDMAYHIHEGHPDERLTDSPAKVTKIFKKDEYPPIR